jgi:hypothetical protein
MGLGIFYTLYIVRVIIAGICLKAHILRIPLEENIDSLIYASLGLFVIRGKMENIRFGPFQS